ncbi:MAG: DUF2493 domain-containing protein [Clostridia bacterium]|nr:DUF2493 domain-containing protein [Clostridia bacterium]
MKLAVIGSRKLTQISIEDYVPEGVTEIVSGGALGVDACARKYAQEHGFVLTEFLPEYERYGRGAPIIRNKQIVDYADKIVAFWDGKSKGTLSVIKYAEKVGKSCEIILV